MMQSTLALSALCAPALYLAAAALFRWRAAPSLGLAAIGAAFAAAIASDVLVYILPGSVSAPLTFLDPLSAAILTLITFVGFIVVRYSITYLDGDPEQPRFMAWLCLTLAAVSTLVVAGDLVVFSLAWIATSLALHQLL